MRALLAGFALALAGCYDLDALEKGEVGIRVVASDNAPAPGTAAPVSLTLRDTVESDLQLLAMHLIDVGGRTVPPLDGWTFLRQQDTCQSSRLVLHFRFARGSEDERVDVQPVLPLESVAAVMAVGIRGVDPALPLGPVDVSVDTTLTLSPEVRAGQSWGAFAGSESGALTVTMPGMSELASNGYLSFLFGEPELAADRSITYTVGDASCRAIGVAALLPR